MDTGTSGQPLPGLLGMDVKSEAGEARRHFGGNLV